MEKEDWENIKKHYSFLVDLNEYAREDYLKKITKKDASLAIKLREMLKADHDDSTFMSKPAMTKLKEVEEPDFFLGKEIDRYKLMFLIGIGGMGNVYLAERTDLEAHQQVVVKIMNTGYLSSIHRKRFERERKILSRLNHPHITRIYDGGITDQGLPYIVMEFIEGKPLMEYIADNDLSIDERLELFIDICSAVSYAHQNFIMHRDLKPANILVTHHGIVKVIDFGIAKILQDDDEDMEQLTSTGILPMTPAYASPEQLANKPLTIASDVYSLGVVFYELLTENKPFSISKNTNLSTIEKMITVNDPLKPSISVSPEISRFSNLANWKKKIQGDLDNIILKAIKKEPAQRYLSVEHLIDDINRYKNNYPVLARPDSVGYRVKKYVRRHRVSVASGIALFLVLILGVAATLWQAQIAKTERDLAQYEASKARQITNFLIDLFENNDPDRLLGDTLTADRMLKMGSENIDKLIDQPELYGEMLKVIGQLYHKQRIFDQSKLHLENSLKVFQEHFGDDYFVAAQVKVELAETLRYLDDKETALKFVQEAETIIEKHFGKNSLEYIKALSITGQIYTDLAQYDTALEYLNQALEVYNKIENPTDKEYNQLAIINNDIARIYHLNNDYPNAIIHYKKALKINKSIQGEISQNVAALYYNIGVALRSSNPDSAEIYALNSLNIVKQVFGDKPNDRLRSSLRLLADISRDKGEFEQAYDYANEAYQVAKEVFGINNVRTAFAMYSLAQALYANNNYKDATYKFLEATIIFEETLGKDHPTVGLVYSENASYFYRMKNLDQCILFQKRTVAFYKNNFPDDISAIAKAKQSMAMYFEEYNQIADAEQMLLKSHAILKDTFGNEDENTIIAFDKLTQFYAKNSKLSKSEM